MRFERRKDRMRRRLARILPIIVLYVRKNQPRDPKEIARALNLSPYTVRRVLRNILRSL